MSLPRPTSPALSETGFESFPSRSAAIRGVGDTGTGRRMANTQANIAKRVPKPVVNAADGLFKGYAASGIKIQHSENKIGIMPGLSGVINDIAQRAGVSLDDPEQSSLFLECLVTDVYVNAYSDKQTFDGVIKVGDFELPRVHIRNAIEPKVGTNHRRFARAMAPLVAQVMHDNYDTFAEILDKRANEQNLGTRAEAVNAFDGADALSSVDRTTSMRNAEVRAIKLQYRSGDYKYAVGTSAVAEGGKGGDIM